MFGAECKYKVAAFDLHGDSEWAGGTMWRVFRDSLSFLWVFLMMGVVPALTERHNREQFMHTSEQTSCEHSLITVKDPLKLFPSFRLFMAITFNYKGNMQSALIK